MMNILPQDNNNSSTQEIVLHHFVCKIRREMNWRKRSVGLNATEANDINNHYKFQKECVSWLEYIASTIVKINKIATIQSKKLNLPLQTYLSSSDFAPLLKSLRMTAIGVTIQIKQAEDFIQQTTSLYRHSNTYTLSEHKNRTIEALTDTEACEWTRFTKSQLIKLCNLFCLPFWFTVHKSHYYDSEFVLILSLTYFANGEHMSTLREKFGGNSDFFASVIKEFVQHLYELFYDKISGDSLSFYSDDDFRNFSRAIFDRVTKIPPKELEKLEKGKIDSVDQLKLNLNEFRPCSFIDDTSICSCRPGSGPVGEGGKDTDRREFNHEIQKAFYSGYAKEHGLKSQALCLPNGMWGSVWVCALKHNDLGVLNMSGLCEYLMDVLPMIKDEDDNDIHLAVYGDSIFKPSNVILRRIEEPKTEVEKLLNSQMNSCRTSVEMNFGSAFGLFKLLEAKKKMKLYENGKYNRKLIIIIFFLHNCYTCMNGNSVSSMFEMNQTKVKMKRRTKMPFKLMK